MVDSGRLDDLAALFAHGRIEAVPDAPPKLIHEGPAAVRSMYDGVRIYDDGTPKTKHVTTNAVIDVDEASGTATSRSHYTVTQATADLPLQIIITGRYHDTFHCLDDRWWFATRVMYIDQMGDLSHHLTFTVDTSTPNASLPDGET